MDATPSPRGTSSSSAAHTPGSRVGYTAESVRMLRPGVALAHVRATLAVPAGPMAGDHQARYSAVLTHDDGRWQIASFHNTFITTPGAPPR